MPFFGAGARKASRCGVLGGAPFAKGAAPADVQGNIQAVDGMTVEDEVSEQKRLAQERARKEIEQWAKRDAEARQRQEAAAAAEIKGKIDLFLMAYGYEGINSRRIRWMKVKYPLHSAVKHRDVEMITLLLRAGANPAVTNSAGETPEQLAYKLQDNRLLEAFSLA